MSGWHALQHCLAATAAAAAQFQEAHGEPQSNSHARVVWQSTVEVETVSACVVPPPVYLRSELGFDPLAR